MSAYRETNHDMANMTERDIAFLLAEAADEAEVGIAPTQALIRGGRRRRARRWAVATAAALAIVGSTGTLALAGLPGGDGRGAEPATRPPAPSVMPELYAPRRTVLAAGTEDGKEWKVTLDMWPAPSEEVDAQAQLDAMRARGENPPDVDRASDLVGKRAYFVHRSYGGKSSLVIENTLPGTDVQAGTDLDAGALSLVPGSGSSRLVVGRVAKAVRQVTCVWKDGTSTSLHRTAVNSANGGVPQGIRSAGGSPDDWFVCLAPRGTAYKSAEVTAYRSHEATAYSSQEATR
ncbi:hypothetical protein [Streptomyces sp. NPDC020996]|uniref:hypothetical protein n=1 Tax=Streptomyces sp. NPDC020996 TaxID=3154791 RepID=UPI0033C66BD2